MKEILLIEHDADVRDMIRFILEDEGFKVLAATPPQDLDYIAGISPVLILIDEWLGAEPGQRLCLRIKQYEQTSHVPVIIISTAQQIEQLVAECRADDYIRKPFDLDELVTKVKQLCR